MVNCCSHEELNGLNSYVESFSEPGYYKAGEFGIRIEDVIESVEAPDTRFDFDGRGALKFRPITLVPFQLKMIDLSLLTEGEIEWIDDYHQKVKDEVGPLVEKQDPEAYKWLVKQTEPLPRPRL